MASTDTLLVSRPTGWLPEGLLCRQGMRQLLHALFEGNPGMVIVADAKQRIVAANSNALAGFGYLREELEGQPVSMLLPEGSRERHDGQMRSFLAHSPPRFMGSGMDLKARDARGKEFAVNVMLWPFSEEGRRFAVAICRRPDEALARSQAQMRAMRDGVRDFAINLLDSQGRILTWNEGSRRIHGLGSAEAVGRHISLLFLSGDANLGEPERMLCAAANSGRCKTEGWLRGPAGLPIWAEIDLTSIRDESGQLTGFTCVLHDMTAHKQDEAALLEANRELMESEERFRLLIEHVADYAIYMLDPGGRVVTWNKGAERAKGFKAEEVLGQDYSIFFLPEDVSAGAPARELATAARDGRYEIEAWRRRKDGSKFWALVTLTAIHGKDGKLLGFAKVTREMTLQKQASDALLTLNAQLDAYRIFVENVHEYAIYTMNAEGVITTWGVGAQKVSGAAPEQVLGRHYSMFFPPAAVLEGLPQHQLDEAARTGRYPSDAWMITPAGVREWTSGVLTAVRDESGKLTGFIRVSRVMTKQKLLEESLERLTIELEDRVKERTRLLESTVTELRHKNEEVEAFVYIVSHDLRAPLVNLMGFSRELQASCVQLKALIESCALPDAVSAGVFEILDAEMPSAVHFISQSSLKFERLIDALLNLSRYGRQIYQIVEVDVEEVVASAIAILQQAIAEAGAGVEVGRLPPATADATALGQVFSNLIGNCLKYRSPDRPLKVEVGGDADEGNVHYWVRDNGLGIPDAVKSRLFQVFQRFHPQRAQGEGMGLAIAHRIVERHGGRIWAESRDGEGATFHFLLPMTRGSVSAIAERSIDHGV
jgi:PAS domain S-box-containing protein